MTLNDAVEEIFRWQHEYTDSFYNRLITLFQIADSENLNILSKAYPLLYIAFLAWQASGDNGDDLFRKWRLLDDR